MRGGRPGGLRGGGEMAALRRAGSWAGREEAVRRWRFQGTRGCFPSSENRKLTGGASEEDGDLALTEPAWAGLKARCV